VGGGLWGGPRCSGENGESRFALGSAVHRAHSGEDRFALGSAALLWGFTQSTQSLRSKRLYPEQRFACGVTQFPQSALCARLYPEQRGSPQQAPSQFPLNYLPVAPIFVTFVKT
jgi:hypothetical protein